jgi:hypothetical protein
MQEFYRGILIELIGETRDHHAQKLFYDSVPESHEKQILLDH